MEPLPPPVQLGEIMEEELKQYDGSDSKSPFSWPSKARSMLFKAENFCKACDSWEIWRFVEKVMVSTNHNIPRAIWVAVPQITEYLLGIVKIAHPQLSYESMIWGGGSMQACPRGTKTTSTVINSDDDEHCHHLRRKHEALIIFSHISLSRLRHQGDEIPINSGDEKHYHQLRRNYEALVLQRHLGMIPKSRDLRFKYEASILNDNGLAIISRPLAIIVDALTVLSLAFLRNVAYDIVSLLLLVLVKLSSVQKNSRKHLLLNFLMSLLLLVLVKLSSVQKNFRKHLCSFRKVFQKLERLDKEDDTHVSTKEKSRYRYDGMLDTETMIIPTYRTVAHLLKHLKETKESCGGDGGAAAELRETDIMSDGGDDDGEDE
ncbi:hypothetical protein Bca4012_099193 [Brassica carinata]